MLRPVRLLAPLDGSDRESLRPPGTFTSRLSTGSVALTVAGYNYNSDWTPLLAGLSPAGMAASLAALALTVRAKSHARVQVPAVIHADGTARLQIVREHTDAVTHAYSMALGRRIGVEVAVNTSFNVAGPIAQSPVQAID